MNLIFQGDEQLIVDKNDNYRLKEIRGYHMVDKDGNEFIGDLKFFDAHITDNNTIDVNCCIDKSDGKKKFFEITIREGFSLED